jgi:hypothetical protein
MSFLTLPSGGGAIIGNPLGGGSVADIARHSIIWRQGVPSDPSNGVYDTFVEVAAIITLYQGNVDIYVDSTFAPLGVNHVTGITNCFGRTDWYPYTYNVAGLARINIDDGATLRNPYRFFTLNVTAEPLSGVYPIVLDIPATGLQVREGGILDLGALSTTPFVLQSVDSCILASNNGGIFTNSSPNPLLAFWDTAVGLTLTIFAISSLSGTSGPPAYTNRLFNSPGGATLAFIFDDSCQPVPQILWFGGTFNVPMSFASGNVYNDTTVSTTSLSANTVQDAIDVLKQRVTGFGITGSRPIGMPTGAMYFDTTLGYAIWFDGVNWVDAAGVVV